MSTFDLPTTTRVLRLASRPTDRVTTEQFAMVEVPLPAPRPGHVLVRNEHLALGAVMRERMDPDAVLPPALPLYQLDAPVTGAAVGRVVASAREDVPVGTLVAHHGPWADHAESGSVVPLPEDALPEPWYHLATANGATALLGVRDVAQVGPGDVVLVSGAAGGVGSLAGGIARRLGARTVIGTAGSARKCRWLVDELGFDHALDYHSDDLVGELRAVAPDGITAYLDLVGGAQFEAAVAVAAPGARIAVGGALATQQSGAQWPRLDTQSAIVKNLTITAYALASAPRLVGEWPRLFGGWLGEGMVYPHTVVDGGLGAAPGALVDLLDGAYTGNVSVRL